MAKAGELNDQCIVTDGDGRWFVIPVDRFDDWVAWFFAPDDEYDGVPTYAHYIPMSKVGLIGLTFKNYKFASS